MTVSRVRATGAGWRAGLDVHVPIQSSGIAADGPPQAPTGGRSTMHTLTLLLSVCKFCSCYAHRHSCRSTCQSDSHLLRQDTCRKLLAVCSNSLPELFPGFDITVTPSEALALTGGYEIVQQENIFLQRLLHFPHKSAFSPDPITSPQQDPHSTFQYLGYVMAHATVLRVCLPV